MATIIQSGGLQPNDGVVQTDTSFGVAVASLPATGLYLLVDSEEMYAYETSADGKTLRVIRGVNGSTPAVHANGATITSHGRITSLATKAGIPSDADFNASALPPVGTLMYDTTNSKLSVRHSAGTWKQSAALT